jgi:hypothetical protein
MKRIMFSDFIQLELKRAFGEHKKGLPMQAFV